jgi:sigma-E factor negative regulatory protein RseB
MRRPGRAASIEFFSIAFCSIALLASFAARGEEIPPQELLRRMSAALRDVDFQGSFIYQHDGRTDALRIFHQGGGLERERLVSLTGGRGEIIRNAGTITCVQSDASSTLFSNRADERLLPLVPNVRKLGAQYSVATGGMDRVAGYDARIVDISPRDPYRYGYRLWLQQDNQLLLRSAVVDAARRPIEQFMFVALDIGAKPSETDLLPTENVADATSPMDEVEVNSDLLWTVVGAPAGFRLVRAQRPLGGSTQAEHLVYSDGIASVSVYIEPQADSAQAATESTIVRGVLSVHSRNAGALHITALGDVPPATVQAMARNVRASAGR